jgi:PAS domain S-box-containing protein
MLAFWPAPSKTAETLLFRHDGEQVVFLNELRHRQDTAAKLHFPLASKDLLATKFLRGEARGGEAIAGHDYRDIPVVGVIRAIPGTDWFMVAKMDRAELYEEAISDAAWVALAGLLALFATAVATMVLRQRQQLALADGVRLAQDERLQALSLLEASESRFRALVEQSMAGIYIIQDGVLRYANPGFARIFAYESPEMLVDNVQIADLVCPEDRARVAENIRLRQDGEIADIQYTFTGLRRDGQRVALEVYGRSFDFAGHPAVIGLLFDISARQAAEDALRTSEKRFQDIVMASTDWVWEVDTEWRYTYVSGSVRNLLGYTTEEILGKTPFDFMPPEEAQRVKALLEERIARRLPIRDLDNINICKDGSLCHVQTSGSPILDSNGALLGYRGLDHDITDKKYTELFLRQQAEGLSQRNRELERFNRAMVGRELDMIELKKTINALSSQLGQDPPYHLPSTDTPDNTVAEPLV